MTKKFNEEDYAIMTFNVEDDIGRKAALTVEMWRIPHESQDLIADRLAYRGKKFFICRGDLTTDQYGKDEVCPSLVPFGQGQKTEDRLVVPRHSFDANGLIKALKKDQRKLEVVVSDLKNYAQDCHTSRANSAIRQARWHKYSKKGELWDKNNAHVIKTKRAKK